MKLFLILFASTVLGMTSLSGTSKAPVQLSGCCETAAPCCYEGSSCCK